VCFVSVHVAFVSKLWFTCRLFNVFSSFPFFFHLASDFEIIVAHLSMNVCVFSSCSLVSFVLYVCFKVVITHLSMSFF
jgi:hypothetical protein